MAEEKQDKVSADAHDEDNTGNDQTGWLEGDYDIRESLNSSDSVEYSILREERMISSLV